MRGVTVIDEKPYINGRQVTRVDACKALGVSPKTVEARVGKGWTLDRALYTPVRRTSQGLRAKAGPGAEEQARRYQHLLTQPWDKLYEHLNDRPV